MKVASQLGSQFDYDHLQFLLIKNGSIAAINQQVCQNLFLQIDSSLFPTSDCLNFASCHSYKTYPTMVFYSS